MAETRRPRRIPVCRLCSARGAESEATFAEGARDASAAEVRGDDAAANEAWRRYRLIQDASRDPDELLAEGIALSNMALELAGADRGSRP